MRKEALISYSRAQAMEDGVLVDVSVIGREAGFVFPVALTRALHEDIAAIPAARSFESYDARLWDVLFMCHVAIKTRLAGSPSGAPLYFQLVMTTGDVPEDDNQFDADDYLYHVKAICGPGDDLRPVLTLMKPEED